MAEIKKTDSVVKPVAAVKTPVVAPVVKKTEVKAAVAAPAKAETKKAEPKKAAKKPATKKAEAKKAEPKKAEAKKETKAVAKKPAAKKPAAKKTAAKKPATRKAATKSAEVKTNIVLQYGDKAVSYAELIVNAKNKFQYDMGGDAEAVKKVSLYVKPEENKVYFVMDDKVQGSYDL